MHLCYKINIRNILSRIIQTRVDDMTSRNLRYDDSANCNRKNSVTNCSQLKFVRLYTFRCHLQLNTGHQTESRFLLETLT